jgi:hypothetical protein
MAPLRHVLPAMAAAEPVTAFLCGRYVFGERLSGGVSGVVGVGGGLLLMVCGVVLCALGRTVPAAPALAPATPAATAPLPAPAAAGETEGELALAPSGRAQITEGCDDDDPDCLPPPVLGIGVPLRARHRSG